MFHDEILSVKKGKERRISLFFEFRSFAKNNPNS